MSSTIEPMKLTKENLSYLYRAGFSRRIVRALEKGEMPWQKPWQGHGPGVGFPRDARTRKKFFGVNFLLLQMAAKEHDFVSSWWGTADQFAALGSSVGNRPEHITPGDWAAGIVHYQMAMPGKVLTTCFAVYNADQLSTALPAYKPKATLMPAYDLAETVLHSTDATIEYNSTGEAWYFYPPRDSITLPYKRVFEAGLGGLPGYYESLAHELVHWTESRVMRDTSADEATRELRADIGAAMLLEELGVPHSISFANFYKWRDRWVELLKNDRDLIFQVCASATAAADYILGFSGKAEGRFNQLDESLA